MQFTDLDTGADVRQKDDYTYISTSQNNGLVINRTKVGKGNWQLLCKVDEMTEGIAREFVRKVTLGYYFDYMKPNRRHDYMCATPGESWNSLLQANEVWFENPYKQIDKKYFNKVHFENTQQNVWEINRTYIFKEI